MALVEIGDDEQPVKRDTGASASAGGAGVPVEGKPDPASRPKKAWGDMTPAQQAGLLCGDPIFQRFLYETNYLSAAERDDPGAAVAVRRICNVTSRKDIENDADALALWRALVIDFRNWQRGVE
jgi:hypothetical protein